jgi:arylsulfatase B/arylsulfatase I/J
VLHCRHLGYKTWDYTPIGRGFDSYAGYLQGANDYYTHKIGHGFDLWRNKTVAWDFYGKHSTEFYMEEAQRVLNSRDPLTPMFMYFAHQELHAPDEEPPDSVSLQACATYEPASPIGQEASTLRKTLCSMASNVDAAIGRFVDMLKAKAMWEDTLFWLTTDTGGMTYGIAADGIGPIARSASTNWPLRGGKATLFEGDVRGVSFVCGGFVPIAARGTSRSELMQHVDIPATMAKLAGAEWTVGTPDGMNVWEAIVSGTPSNLTEVPLNIDMCDPAGPPCAGRATRFNALISTKWKLIEANFYTPHCPNATWCTGAGLDDGYWTNDPYVHIALNSSQASVPSPAGLANGGLWLFDLSLDPNEQHNVAAANPLSSRRCAPGSACSPTLQTATSTRS